MILGEELKKSVILVALYNTTYDYEDVREDPEHYDLLCIHKDSLQEYIDQGFLIAYRGMREEERMSDLCVTDIIYDNETTIIERK